MPTPISPKPDVAGRDLASDTVFMVQHGILDGWVCAPKHMNADQVQAAVRRDIFPAGTSAGWLVQEREGTEKFNGTDASPGLCGEDDSRQHWYVVC